MEMNGIIELNPLIYPMRVWVGVRLTDKDIAHQYWGLDENGYRVDITNDISKRDESVVATCHPVSHKESGWRGILLNVHRPKAMSAGIMAHEAEHIICWICEIFGISSNTFDDSEPRAYLMQWLVDEIWNILTKQKKK